VSRTPGNSTASSANCGSTWTETPFGSITYWIAPDRRIILLTVFRKTPRMQEGREVERARRSLGRCIAEAHTADEEET
jgi:hypothetical protein